MMDAKTAAAREAVRLVQEGMTVGLGTGSTASVAIGLLGEIVRKGLSIKAVASSLRSEALARESGIDIVSFADVDVIDIYIDGADEVDENLNLIKGGGGALMRERMLAWHSRQFIVIVNESKRVKNLGRARVPVELLPFAHELTIRSLAALDARTVLRMDGSTPFTTDNGNLIVDCDFGLLSDPVATGEAVSRIPGVVTQGVFSRDLVHEVIVGNEDGSVQHLRNGLPRR